jgi:hypothetical protein
VVMARSSELVESDLGTELHGIESEQDGAASDGGGAVEEDLQAPGVVMQRTLVGGSDDAVVVGGEDGDDGVLSSAVFGRGNGCIDVDYFRASVTLDAPFIWAAATCTLCSRGRHITDKMLSGEVTEIVQQSGIYIHVSARDGLLQRLQDLGVPVRPAKLSVSLVLTEVVVATDTLRAALAASGVSHVVLERIGGKVDLSVWARKVLPYVVDDSVLIVDVGCNHGRRRLDRDRLGYSLLPPQPEHAVDARVSRGDDAHAGQGAAAASGGSGSEPLPALQQSDASASAAPLLTVVAVDGVDDVPHLTADPYISLFRVNSDRLPKAEHARLSATEQLERGYGYVYRPIFNPASELNCGGSGGGDGDASTGCGRGRRGGDAELDGDVVMAAMEPHDRRWLHCSVNLMAVNASRRDREGDAVVAVDMQTARPTLRRMLPLGLAANDSDGDGIPAPRGSNASDSATQPSEHRREDGHHVDIGIRASQIKATVECHPMFCDDTAAGLGGVAGGVNFTLEVWLECVLLMCS